MNKKPIVLMLSGFILSGIAQAGTMGAVAPDNSWHWVGTISAGPAWAKAGTTQSFYLTPEIEKTYVASKVSKVMPSGELFLGGQKGFNGDWQGQLGLAVGVAGSAKAQGIIWDDADPEFDNHSYSYRVMHSRVAVKGKILKDCGFWLTPWVSGSAGVAFNRAHDYHNTPLIFEALPNPNFADKTKTTFTYTVGVGVQKNIDEHLQVGVGYEYADWGKNGLGRAFEQTLNSGLQMNHLSTNSVLFNLTYVA